MPPKSYEKLVHVRYSDNFPVSSRMVVADFNEYQSPLAHLVNQNLHGWGVVSGLEVTATADGTGVQVAAGVAVDRHGQLLVLATGGAATLGSQPPLTETTVPVVLTAPDALKGQKVVVTIELYELQRTIIPPPGLPNDFPNGKLEQAPWVNLVPAQNFTDSDDLVVLALADVGTDGKVSGIVSLASGVAPARQRLGATLGQLTIERPASDSAQQVAMGVLGPLTGSTGLQLTAALTAFTGKVCVAPAGATPPADMPGSLVVLSSTPGGGGGVETRDANNKRMASLRTTGLGAQQAGFISVGTAAGSDVVTLGAGSSGAGQVQVQTRAGKPAVVLDTVGGADDGALHIFANNQEIITLGTGGVSSHGSVSCSFVQGQNCALSSGGVSGIGWSHTAGGTSGTGWGLSATAASGSSWVVSAGGVSGNGWSLSAGGVSGNGWSHSANGVATNGWITTNQVVRANGQLQAGGNVLAGGVIQTSSEFIVVSGSTTRAKLTQDGNGGRLAIWNKHGTEVVTIWVGDNNVGIIRVYDANRQNGHWLDGSGPKSFVMSHPQDSSKDIVYACLEGPEAAAYLRGRAALNGGTTRVAFPEHFALVVNPDTLTIQLTPRSAASKGLAVVESGADGFLVRELLEGTGSYEFDYFVCGVRKGSEAYQPVVAKGFSPLGHRMAPAFDVTGPGAATAVSPTQPGPSPVQPTPTDAVSPAAAPSDEMPARPQPWDLL